MVALNTGLARVAGKATRSRTGQTFAVQLVGMLLAALSQLLVGRLLGPDGYGQFVQGFSALALLGLAALLGMRTASQRFIPTYLEQGDTAGLASFIRWAWILVGAAAVVLMVLASIIVSLTDGSSTMLLAVLAVPVYAAMALGGAMVRAFGRPVLSVALGRPAREAGVLLAVVLALITGVAAPLPIMGGLVAALAVSAVISVTCVRRRRGAAVTARVYDRMWLSRSLPMMAVNLGNMVLRRADILIVGYFAGSAAAGIYGICVFATELLALPLQTIGILFAPQVSRLRARGDTAALTRYVRRMARLSGGAALAIAVPVWLFAEPILALVGPEYVSGAAALRILLLGQVIRAALGNVNLLSMMTGGERAAARALVLVVAMAVILHLFLTARFGVDGAAATTAFTVTAHSLLLAWIGWRHSGVRPGPV